VFKKVKSDAAEVAEQRSQSQRAKGLLQEHFPDVYSHIRR